MQNPRISPPASASISMGTYEMCSAARYPAAKGVMEMQKFATQKATPPERVRRKMVRQLRLVGVIFLAPLY